MGGKLLFPAIVTRLTDIVGGCVFESFGGGCIKAVVTVGGGVKTPPVVPWSPQAVPYSQGWADLLF